MPELQLPSSQDKLKLKEENKRKNTCVGDAFEVVQQTNVMQVSLTEQEYCKFRHILNASSKCPTQQRKRAENALLNSPVAKTQGRHLPPALDSALCCVPMKGMLVPCWKPQRNVIVKVKPDKQLALQRNVSPKQRPSKETQCALSTCKISMIFRKDIQNPYQLLGKTGYTGTTPLCFPETYTQFPVIFCLVPYCINSLLEKSPSPPILPPTTSLYWLCQTVLLNRKWKNIGYLFSF